MVLCISTGKKAIPVLKEFLIQYDSAEVTVNSDEEQISQLMEPLGLHRKRAQILMQFSSELYHRNADNYSMYLQQVLRHICAMLVYIRGRFKGGQEGSRPPPPKYLISKMQN